MLKNKTIAVVIPAYNEGTQIGRVVETIPDFVDRIIIVNDCSKDKTEEIVRHFIEKDHTPTIEIKDILNDIQLNDYNRADFLLQEQLAMESKYFIQSELISQNPVKSRIILINLLKNCGKGAAIARGYKWCRDHGIDCVAIMDGDGQMDPVELESICKPVIEDNVDYVKGNRLIHRSAWLIIPKTRYFGNSILSILTKIASGYWHISDTQSGYTAISNKALNAIKLHQIYKSYGMPNDMLVKLNIAFCTLREVEIKPVYNIGEKSKMNIPKVILGISWLLFKSFFKRLWIKYLFRDFHPLFILYHLSIFLIISAFLYGIKILKLVLLGQQANPLTILAFCFLFFTGFAQYCPFQINRKVFH